MRFLNTLAILVSVIFFLGCTLPMGCFQGEVGARAATKSSAAKKKKSLVSSLKAKAKQLAKSAASTAKNVVNAAVSKAKKVVASARAAVSSVISKAKVAFSSAKSKVAALLAPSSQPSQKPPSTADPSSARNGQSVKSNGGGGRGGGAHSAATSSGSQSSPKLPRPGIATISDSAAMTFVRSWLKPSAGVADPSCVNFAKAFLYAAGKRTAIPSVGSAANWFKMIAHRDQAFEDWKIRDPSSTAKVGDLVFWKPDFESSNAGHVAVVIDVDGRRITVAQQNLDWQPKGGTWDDILTIDIEKDSSSLVSKLQGFVSVPDVDIGQGLAAIRAAQLKPARVSNEAAPLSTRSSSASIALMLLDDLANESVTSDFGEGVADLRSDQVVPFLFADGSAALPERAIALAPFFATRPAVADGTVPESGTWTLFGPAITLAIWIRRRRTAIRPFKCAA